MSSVAKTIITTVVVNLYYPIVLTELLWGCGRALMPPSLNLMKQTSRKQLTGC